MRLRPDRLWMLVAVAMALAGTVWMLAATGGIVRAHRRNTSTVVAR